MALEWREQLSVGNEVIDADHKRLIGLINDAEAGLKGRNWDLLSATLEELTEYAHSHFIREEKIAQAAGYAGCSRLNQEHERLRKQLRRARNELEGMRGEWSEATIKHFVHFLREWLLQHVIQEDLLMKPVLKNHPGNLSPDNLSSL